MSADVLTTGQILRTSSGSSHSAPPPLSLLGPTRRAPPRTAPPGAAAARRVDARAVLADLVGLQPLRVDPVELVGLDPAHAVADVLHGVGEVEHAALAEQDRVAEILLEALPQLQRVLVDGRATVHEVVGAGG